MGRVTAASLFALICFIGVAYGMDCSFGRFGVLGELVNSCPSPLFGSSTASYCCLRPNRDTLSCCEAAEFYGVIFGSIFIFALLIGCCCSCCVCCPCYHWCHRKSTNVTVVDSSGYPGTNQPGIAMHQQYPSHTGYVRA